MFLVQAGQGLVQQAPDFVLMHQLLGDCRQSAMYSGCGMASEPSRSSVASSSEIVSSPLRLRMIFSAACVAMRSSQVEKLASAAKALRGFPAR